MSINVKYRRDLDGLRAVAVWLVMLTHAEVPLVGGGFIGVDVFFVLSGFLITYVIKEEIADHTFSLSNFYLRRIRRLMPAFFVVVIATTAAASLLLLPRDLRTFTQSLIYSSTFLANMYFWKQELLYFAPVSAELPLLHMWSLAVEEQFYLLWPLFLFIGYRYLGPRLLAASVLIAFTLSLLASQLAATSWSYADDAYYLLPFRAFELLMGGMVALYYLNLPALRQSTRVLASVLGILLIGLPAFLLTEESTFPGINAFYPCLGTAILIVTGKEKQAGINRFLSADLMVGTGKISYSLYLWHWPILAFMQYHAISLNMLNISTAIALTFVLSYLTWRFIEKPFRFAFTYDFKTTAIRLFGLPLIVPILAGLLFVFLPNGYSLVDKTVLEEVQGKFSSASIDTGWCHAASGSVGSLPFESSQLNCFLGSQDEGAVRAVVWGDSHAGHFEPFLDYVGKSNNISISGRSTPACFPSFSPTRFARSPEVCNAFKRNLRETISEYDIVFIASRWESMNEHDYAGLEDALDLITSKVDTVYLFLQVPSYRTNQAECFLKKTVFAFTGCSLNNDDQRNRDYIESNKRVSALTAKYPNIQIVDVGKIFCTEKECSPYLQGEPLYRNKDHLSILGAQRLARLYDW